MEPTDTQDAIQEFIMDCQARALKPKTIAGYQWALDYLAKHCPNLPSHRRQLRPVLAQPQLAKESIRTLRTGVSRFLNWCVAEGLLPANPMRELDRLGRGAILPRALTRAEIRQTLEACETRRDRAMVILYLETGIRLEEMAQLRRPDIQDASLKVRGKRGERVVPLSPEVQRLLLGLGDGFHLWVGKQGPLTRAGVQHVIRDIFQKAGLSGPKLNGPHVLRHTFGTEYIRSRGSLEALKKILGHAVIATTELYIHQADNDVAADHARHSPVRTLNLLENLEGPAELKI